MPLSSVIGSSSIMQPGVCTSSTRPASPYDGQVIYETDTDRTLVYNGTGWVFLSTSRANPVGIDLIATGSFTSQTTVSLPTGTFSATYKNYRIVLHSNLQSSTLTLRFRTSGTDNTGTYSFSRSGVQGNVTSFGDSFINLAYGWDTASTHSWELNVYRPFETAHTNLTWVGHSAPANYAGIGNTSGYATMHATTSFDSLTFISSVSSHLTGTYQIYGMVN
jgi:hypothetical protein